VRLQTSDDAVHLKKAFDKLSTNSKRLRYFSVANVLSDKDWEHYRG
jgi:regulation of enolase protein 1 (concanavalin A-like superfamily)